MTQSGQGEEPSPREAREGIVLPSDGGEPLLPGMLAAQQGPVGPQPGQHAGQQTGPYSGHQTDPYDGQTTSYDGQTTSYNGHTASYDGQTAAYNGPQAPAAAPPGGQAWGTPWGPDQNQISASQPGEGWPTPPGQSWGTPDQQQAQVPDQQQAHTDQWGAPASGPSGALPPESAQGPSYGGQPAIAQPPANTSLPPAHPGGGYGAPAAPGAYGGPLPPVADEGATQYIPPVAAAADEGATQYIPPVAPGALPPEVRGGERVSEATQFLGHAPQAGGGALPPPTFGSAQAGGHQSGPDAEATQYIAPVPGQSGGAPYGMPQGGDRQPPAEFDNLFRSAPGGESPAAATQQMPRFEQQPPQANYAPPQSGYAQPQPAYAPPGDDGRGGRGGPKKSRVPLIAAVGVGIVVLGVGAGALLGGGGGDHGKDKNQNVSATAPATDGSSSAAADPAKQQAVALDKLLADSGDSRASVIRAVADVKGCKNQTQAASDLRDAAKQRTQLVTRLSGLSVGRLPNHDALTASLTKAWQASAAADNHYAAWADQVGGKKGCKKGQARATGQTQAGNRSSGVASAEKVRAAQLWNAIAKTYGLTQRQPTQL
ncbi:hypothetical protein [Streptomyces sp. NBC_00847]|uniref:hypothetical protein n=1 Tax=Streptomyces sp. NBC_00847 TaxID=2975850 RepID=UPI00225BE033|nr:hypothetical protein [Streptomyces sp. NBC_00847]MCX4881607.1 hypothetical protein [Streptomyces sp. NBC_00847]